MAIFSFANQYIPDPTRDTALAGGSLYIGDPETDPELPANQIPIFAIQEDGTEVQISQPVEINAGGVVVYNGSPIQISFVQNSYSAKVTKNGAQYYYVARTTTTEGISISEWSSDTDYIKDFSIVRGSDGKGYISTDNSGPTSTPVDPVTDTDESHWKYIAIITPVGEGDDEIPTNSMVKGRFIVGQIGNFGFSTVPDGWFARDGSSVTNGVVLYPELAAKAPLMPGIVTISGNDLIIEDQQNFDRPKGASSRVTGDFEDDAIRNIEGSINRSIAMSAKPLETGAIFVDSTAGGSQLGGTGNIFGNLKFDASLSVPTASENRPKSTTVLSCIYHGVHS